MIKKGSQSDALRILNEINHNLPLSMPISGTGLLMVDSPKSPEPYVAMNQSFQHGLPVDMIHSPSFQITPTGKSKSKSKSRKRVNPFGNSFDFADAAAALDFNTEVHEIAEAIVEVEAATAAVQVEATASAETDAALAEISADEKFILDSVEQAITTKNISKIYSLLELPFAKKYLSFSSYTVPGIFWLATKREPQQPIAIFKVGPARALNDLTLLKLARLLNLEEFFPKSIIQMLSVGEFIDEQPLPKQFAVRFVAENTEKERIRCVTLDKRGEYYIKQSRAIKEKSLLVGSFQEFIQTTPNPEPITSINAAIMVIFGYLVFVKDFKIDDGGVIQSLDGYPKMVDVAENALTYSSVLLPGEAARGVLSMHMPLVDDVKDKIIDIQDISNLVKQFELDQQDILEGLHQILIDEQTYAASLQQVLDIKKTEPTSFHEGHKFISAPKELAQAICARLLNVNIALKKIQSEGQPVTILGLLTALEPQYGNSYTLAQKANVINNSDGRLSRNYMDALRAFSSSPGKMVGSSATPLAFDQEGQEGQAEHADDLFFYLKRNTPYLVGLAVVAEQEKFIEIMTEIKQIIEKIRATPPDPLNTYPKGDQQLARARVSLERLDKIRSRLEQLSVSDQVMIEFRANVAYLKELMAKRELPSVPQTDSRCTSAVSCVQTPVNTKVFSVTHQKQEQGQGSPEITELLDLYYKDYGPITPLNGVTATQVSREGGGAPAEAYVTPAPVMSTPSRGLADLPAATSPAPIVFTTPKRSVVSSVDTSPSTQPSLSRGRLLSLSSPESGVGRLSGENSGAFKRVIPLLPASVNTDAIHTSEHQHRLGTLLRP